MEIQKGVIKKMYFFNKILKVCGHGVKMKERIKRHVLSFFVKYIKTHFRACFNILQNHQNMFSDKDQVQ